MRKGIYKDEKRGTWYINTKVRVNDELRNVTIRGYLSKSEANADYDRAISQWVKDHTKHCQVIFFKDLLTEVEKDRSTTVKLQTLRCDSYVYSKYLLPAFGDILPCVPAMQRAAILRVMSPSISARLIIWKLPLRKNCMMALFSGIAGV